MKNNSTTLLFLAGAFVLFVIVKILPKFKSAPTHTTGRIEQADDLKSNYSFKQDGSAWIISDGGDTLSEIKIEIASTLSQIDTGTPIVLDEKHVYPIGFTNDGPKRNNHSNK